MCSGHSSLPNRTGPPFLWLPRYHALLALSRLTGLSFSVPFYLSFLRQTSKRWSASVLSPRPASLRITLSLGGTVQYCDFRQHPCADYSKYMYVSPYPFPELQIHIFSIPIWMSKRHLTFIGPKWNTRFPYRDCFSCSLLFHIYVKIRCEVILASFLLVLLLLLLIFLSPQLSINLLSIYLSISH